MKKDKRLLSEIAVLGIKAALYVLLCAVFFVLMSINNPQILCISRTAAVSLLTFFMFGVVMVSVYGGFAVGRQKSRPIAISLSLAVMLTDVVTYLQLQIMNVNEANNDHLILFGPDIWLLLIAAALPGRSDNPVCSRGESALFPLPRAAALPAYHRGRGRRERHRAQDRAAAAAIFGATGLGLPRRRAFSRAGRVRHGVLLRRAGG